MKLTHYFALLALLLSLLWGLLILLTIGREGILVYVAEGLLLASLILLIVFYRKVIKPLHVIAGGMDLLREQDFSSRLAPVGQIEADRIVQIFNKMMEQLKEERLRVQEQNHLLDLLISASPMGVIMLDSDHYITLVNRAATRFLQLRQESDGIGKTLDALTSPLAAEINALSNETVTTIRLNDSTIYRCSKLSFLDRGLRHPFILLESITSEVVDAEKLAYEKVIRMISHEVNNSVAGIVSTFDTLQEEFAEIEGMADLCDVMRVCAQRCYSMSEFITRFAEVVKIPEPRLKPINLNEKITASISFLETMCRHHNIHLSLSLCPENPTVKADIILLEQVLLNVVKNAIESIGSDGEIHISTTARPLSLIIADNGKGIATEVKSNLFTPFFSTKPSGQGVGLLFVREVLIKHNCRFSLNTEADGITRFRILF